MRGTNLNFLLLQLLSTIASVYCIDEDDLFSFSGVLNNGIDNETSPCNDFHQYACGKWIERNDVPDIMDHWNVYAVTEMSTLEKIKDILENPNIDENNEELSVERKFYNACMDEDYSQEEGEKLLLKILHETPRERWQDVLEYYATNFSAFHLFHLKLTESKHLQIERPRFSKSNRGSFKDTRDELISNVEELYVTNVNSYIPNISNIDAMNESVAFLDFMEQITYGSEQNIQTVSFLELQELYDGYCPSRHGKKLAEGTGINFRENDELKVDVQYLEDLCNVLSETPEYAIVNYFQYNFLFDDDTMNTYHMNYNERYIHCIQTLKITEGITKEILKLPEHQRSQRIVHEMFNNIKSAMIKKIEDSLFVNSLKEQMIHKARKIEYKYALIIDPFKTKLGKKVTYKFEVGRVALQNELNLRRAQIINILQLYNDAHKLHRAKRQLVCNACHFKDKNNIVIGLPMMFPTYFYNNAPIGFNYGRLGFTIGHEMSHAFNFDIVLCFIDCIPSEHEREEMDSMLGERLKCFLDEFNSLGVDGSRTAGENVADTQGLKLAWKAMNAVIENREMKGERIPNFKDWNQRKLFFLSFANMWCSNPEYREDDPDDVHAPDVIRGRGTLNNINEFENTYNCPRNPIKKCDLWA